MSQILKTRRLVNPGKRRRNAGAKTRRMSLAQKLHFGTKRQRAAAAARMHNPRKRKASSSTKRGNMYRKGGVRRPRHYRRRRISNVGKIITIRPLPAISNPGLLSSILGSSTRSNRKRKGKNSTNLMARTRRRRTRRNSGTVFGRSWSRRRYRKARPKSITSNPGHRRRSYRRRRNPSVVRTRTIYRNRGRRRSTVVHRRRHIRRNPGLGMGGDFGTAVQIVGGAMVTKFVTDMVAGASPTMASGIPSYIATAVIAVLQGKAIGKLLRNPTLGKNMTTGGFVYLSLRLAQDFLPSFGLPFRLGLVGPSSFYTPQVPLNGNMGSFVPPAGMLAALPHASSGPGMAGLTQRRVGRMR